MSSCLVVENDPTNPAGHLDEWLTDGGLALQVVRAHAGQKVPEDLSGHDALVVLGGDQDAFGPARAPWFPAIEALLRRAVRDRIPTLGICLGAQLLATAHQGTVERSASGPEIGPALIAKRDAAESDPLFGPVPMLPDVLQWHRDEITELPLGAVLLAASSSHPVQAFRIGTAAWGVQFHLEVTYATYASWVAAEGELLSRLGLDGAVLLDRVESLQDDLFEVWHPFAARFAALARGELAAAREAPMPGRSLPLFGQQ